MTKPTLAEELVMEMALAIVRAMDKRVMEGKTQLPPWRNGKKGKGNKRTQGRASNGHSTDP